MGSAAPAWRICGDNDISCVLVGTYDTDRSLPGAAPVGDLWADESHIDTPQEHTALNACTAPTNGSAGPGNAVQPRPATADSNHPLEGLSRRNSDAEATRNGQGAAQVDDELAGSSAGHTGAPNWP
jgi:hypothetical protein